MFPCSKTTISYYIKKREPINKNQRIENEQQILRLVSEGDSRAFRTLYMHYYDRLFNFAMLFPHVAMWKI